MNMRTSITNLFGGGNQPQQPAAQPANNPQANNPQNQPVGEGNPGGIISKGAEPNIKPKTPGSTDGGEGGAKVSPLDPFKDLWQPDKVEGDGGNPDPAKNPAKPTSPDFIKIGKSIDFSRVLNKELVAKALAGDHDAFGQTINSAVQAAFAASGRLAHQLSQTAVAKMRDEMLAQLPSEFKKHSLSNTPLKHAALNHEAIKPLIDVTRQQFAQKYPNANTEELQQMTEDYLSAAFSEVYGGAGAGNPKGGRGTNAQQPNLDPNSKRIQDQATGEYDWTNEFLNDETTNPR